MRSIRAILLSAALAALAPPGAGADSLTLAADRDATLIEDATGMLANGAGPDFFVGRTAQAQGGIRRGLVRFDLAAVPKGAVIDAVRLKLHVSQGTPGATTIGVHRVVADWGEGASASMGGSGVPAMPGDATWIHRFFEPLAPAPPAGPRSVGALWQAPGGDFVPEPSAATLVAGTGFHVWQGPGLMADVEQWLKHPRRGFGWVLIGDEAAPSTARRFESRQNLMQDFRPRLEIDYHRR
jgi:hypothetical protein